MVQAREGGGFGSRSLPVLFSRTINLTTIFFTAQELPQQAKATWRIQQH
jgi:hypothetical protein